MYLCGHDPIELSTHAHVCRTHSLLKAPPPSSSSACVCMWMYQCQVLPHHRLSSLSLDISSGWWCPLALRTSIDPVEGNGRASTKKRALKQCTMLCSECNCNCMTKERGVGGGVGGGRGRRSERGMDKVSIQKRNTKPLERGRQKGRSTRDKVTES
jgi:hypothetical protein